jgi:hypothetical protein
MQAIENAVTTDSEKLSGAAQELHGQSQDFLRQQDLLIQGARTLLLHAVRGCVNAAADLRDLKSALVFRASKADPYACEILAAMCASGLGAKRDSEEAREWLVRAVELLEDQVRRPEAGNHGFVLFGDEGTPYRPLYTAEGVLITDEIGFARRHGTAIRFDRYGRPLVDEGCGGPTRAAPKAVAACIARKATLEDFAWSCRRTTAEFRAALIDARVIAHGRMGFQRYGRGQDRLPLAAPLGNAARRAYRASRSGDAPALRQWRGRRPDSQLRCDHA